MIDIQCEKLISMPQAAALLPGHPSLCALWRWRTKGIAGRRLESVTIGRRPYTTLEAIQRFATSSTGSDTTSVRSPAARTRAVDKAERELREAGV